MCRASSLYSFSCGSGHPHAPLGLRGALCSRGWGFGGTLMLVVVCMEQVVLVRPLSWCGLILPLTPSKLHPYIEAPIPLIVGVTAVPEDVDLCDCVVVDLARGTVRTGCSRRRCGPLPRHCWGLSARMRGPHDGLQQSGTLSCLIGGRWKSPWRPPTKTTTPRKPTTLWQSCRCAARARHQGVKGVCVCVCVRAWS